MGSTAADVDDLSIGLGTLHGQQVGANDVVNANEIAHLFPVFKYQRSLAIQHSRSEDSGHTGVRIGQRLTRCRRY